MIIVLLLLFIKLLLLFMSEGEGDGVCSNRRNVLIVSYNLSWSSSLFVILEQQLESVSVSVLSRSFRKNNSSSLITLFVRPFVDDIVSGSSVPVPTFKCR